MEDLNPIALTFDDGPDERYTPRLLETLAEHGVKATFFLLGRHVDRCPGVARDICRAGHTIGNHTYDHPILTGEGVDIEQQLQACQDTIQNVVGTAVTLFRAPCGCVDSRVRQVASKMSLTLVGWSVDGSDWDVPVSPATTIAGRIMNQVQLRSKPEIAFLHDSSPTLEDRTESVEAARILLTNFSAMNRRFVSIPELPDLERIATRGC